MQYVYSAWFRDPMLPADDQDHEWVACFIVDADTPELALNWGDHLALARSARTGEPFLSSSVEVAGLSANGLPVVRDGHAASDDFIGW